MRHQRHEEAGAHGTRLITAALVLILGAVSLAACAATDRAGDVARAGRPDHVRASDAAPPRLRLPGRIERIAHGPSGVIVRYRSSAVDRRDGRVAARCLPASGSRFHPGFTAVRCSAADRAGNVARGGFAVFVRTTPATTPPLLCLPVDPVRCHPPIRRMDDS
jgi:hypothetical protein